MLLLDRKKQIALLNDLSILEINFLQIAVDPCDQFDRVDRGGITYGSVRSILDNKLDRRPAQKRATDGTPILHANIRGPRYYN